MMLLRYVVKSNVVKFQINFFFNKNERSHLNDDIRHIIKINNSNKLKSTFHTVH